MPISKELIDKWIHALQGSEYYYPAINEFELGGGRSLVAHINAERKTGKRS